MKKSIRASIALAVAALIPAVVSFPATALVAADLDPFVFDCVDMDGTGQSVPLISNTTTVTLANCDGVYLLDFENTEHASIASVMVDGIGTVQVNGNSVTLNLTGTVQLNFFHDYGAPFAGLQALPIYEMSTPSGTKVIDSSKTIPLSADQFTIGTPTEIDNVADISIDGNDNCRVEAGSHVYTVQRFHVKTTGTYTFRVTDVVPTSNAIHLNSEESPSYDPMIALYSGEFNAANPNTNVVGCDDDFNDLTIGGFDWSVPNDDGNDVVYAVTEADKLIEGHYPYFSTTLQPGDYSMVVTTFSTVSAATWASGNGADYDWTPAAADFSYEIWGIAGGIVAVDHFELAATGFDASFGLWSGLALAGTGAGIAAARRRSQRA